MKNNCAKLHVESVRHRYSGNWLMNWLDASCRFIFHFIIDTTNKILIRRITSRAGNTCVHLKKENEDKEKRQITGPRIWWWMHLSPSRAIRLQSTHKDRASPQCWLIGLIVAGKRSPTSAVGLSDRAERVCLHHLSPGGHHIHTPRTDACAGETLVLVRSLTPLPPPPPLLPLCSVCSALLCSPLLWCCWYWCWWCWWCCYPLPKRAEGVVWHLWGRTGWVTYQLWCQAHMAGTSLARAITWEPVIDMRPHSQRLASPRGRGTRHLSPSWKRKWNKEWIAQKKKPHWIQAACVSLHLWEKNGVNLM